MPSAKTVPAKPAGKEAKEAKVDEVSAESSVPLPQPELAATVKPDAGTLMPLTIGHATAQAIPAVAAPSGASIPGTQPVSALISQKTFAPLSQAASASQGVDHAEAARGSAAAMPAADQGTALLRATPNVLEVGVADGAHGWVKVRAEMGVGGEVAASVQAGSAQAAESLRKELPGIAAYLAHEQVGVDSLVVTRAQPAAAAADAGLDHSQRGAPQADSDGRQKQQPSSLAGTVPVPGVDSLEAVLSQMFGGGVTGQAGVGGWLSVLA